MVRDLENGGRLRSQLPEEVQNYTQQRPQHCELAALDAASDASQLYRPKHLIGNAGGVEEEENRKAEHSSKDQRTQKVCDGSALGRFHQEEGVQWTRGVLLRRLPFPSFTHRRRKG